MDPIALTLIQKHGGEYGRERLFSTIGMAIFSPLTGILIDYKTKEQGKLRYSTLYSSLNFKICIRPIKKKIFFKKFMKENFFS